MCSPDAAAAASAVKHLRNVRTFTLFAGSFVHLSLTLSIRVTSPTGAGHRGRGSGFSPAPLRLLFILVRCLVHDNKLVLLPVASLGFLGATGGVLEAKCCVSAAAGFNGRVGLADRPERTLRAANDTFT